MIGDEIASKIVFSPSLRFVLNKSVSEFLGNTSQFLQSNDMIRHFNDVFI